MIALQARVKTSIDVNIVIIEFSHSLLDAADAEEFESKMHEYLRKDYRYFAVALSNVEMMTPSVLGAFLRALKSVRDVRGRLEIILPGEQ